MPDNMLENVFVNTETSILHYNKNDVKIKSLIRQDAFKVKLFMSRTRQKKFMYQKSPI